MAQLVAGEPIAGSWWGHPASHEIFEVINRLAASPDVARMRLVNHRVTLVHRRLWPALLRLEPRYDEALLVVSEEHTASGAHRATTTPLREWVPADVREGRGPPRRRRGHGDPPVRAQAASSAHGSAVTAVRWRTVRARIARIGEVHVRVTGRRGVSTIGVLLLAMPAAGCGDDDARGPANPSSTAAVTVVASAAPTTATTRTAPARSVAPNTPRRGGDEHTRRGGAERAHGARSACRLRGARGLEPVPG